MLDRECPLQAISAAAKDLAADDKRDRRQTAEGNSPCTEERCTFWCSPPGQCAITLIAEEVSRSAR